jgi:hypothetical protein
MNPLHGNAALHATSDGLGHVPDGVLEYRQPLALAGDAAACPSRVLNRVDEAFGVGHQAEDQAAVVADAGDVVGAAVGIVREGSVGGRAIGPRVCEGDLVVVPEGLADVVAGGDELAFAVGDREFETFEAGGPDALF